MFYINYDESSKRIIQVLSEYTEQCNREISEEVWSALSIYGIDNLYFKDDTLVVDFKAAKAFKKAEMCDAFDEEIATGSFESAALGIEVDCRRTETKNDYQNVVVLLSIMQRKNIESVTYVGANNSSAPATQAQLQELLQEMEDRTLELYNTKWAFKAEISAAKDMKDLDKIKIKYKKDNNGNK